VPAGTTLEPATAAAEPSSPAPPLVAAGPSALTLPDALDFVYARLKTEGREPVLERLEREMIERVLKDERGNLARASERLGMTRTTLRKRIEALGLKV
jgi:two-component system nitrogen regulation response regulator GlnG